GQTIPFEQPAAAAGTAKSAPAATRAVHRVSDAVSQTPAMSRVSPALGDLPASAVSDPPLEAADSSQGEIRAERRGAVETTELPSLSAADEAVADLGEFSMPLETHDSPAAQSAAAQSAAAADEPAESAEPAEPSAPSSPGQVRDTAAGVTVDWPPEEQRHIVSVRIVSTGEQRLSGRATRQALAACGFVHGRYRIFHQPDDQGHALVSCASLNKPGIFDPTSMDYQRYSGLSLFTVLPGPLSAPEAVDRLLHTALDLSERLQARLQDDAGQTLDATRIAELRSRFRELDTVAGHPE
ncbi:MAG TPA: cell division protein ZipA C-terminal FtsZ-binding domain-containing protein, partial [Steroidobacteraceae bacterium]|nr:cell division protein ZipA C-terminal FtsZ-binding domain-containing protein [Steroidobacteraceae bacterium]